MKMFKKKCDYCHEKDVFVWGTSRTGETPKAYCGKVCETNAKYDKRFDTRYKK